MTTEEIRETFNRYKIVIIPKPDFKLAYYQYFNRNISEEENLKASLSEVLTLDKIRDMLDIVISAPGVPEKHV